MKYLVFLCVLVAAGAKAQINESDTMRLQMQYRLGGNWQEGNFEIFTIRAAADLSTMLGNGQWVFKTQNNYLYQEVFKRRADEDLFSRNFLYFRPQERVYGFMIGFLSTNFRRKIDRRAFGGAGATWQVIRRPKHLLKIAGGLIYEETNFFGETFNRNFYNGSSQINVWRSSHWLIGRHELLERRLILNYYCFFQPSLQRGDNYRWQTEVYLDMPLFKGLNINFSYIYNHENVIIEGLRNFDQFFTYGISYQLKR